MFHNLTAFLLLFRGAFCNKIKSIVIQTYIDFIEKCLQPWSSGASDRLMCK